AVLVRRGAHSHRPLQVDGLGAELVDQAHARAVEALRRTDLVALEVVQDEGQRRGGRRRARGAGARRRRRAGRRRRARGRRGAGRRRAARRARRARAAARGRRAARAGRRLARVRAVVVVVRVAVVAGLARGHLDYAVTADGARIRVVRGTAVVAGGVGRG